MADSPYYVPSGSEHSIVSSYFIGPKAENMDFMSRLIQSVLNYQKEHRTSYHPEDPHFISEGIQTCASFKDAQGRLEASLEGLTKLLTDHSIPFFSPRYSAHMCMENAMPSILGYIATMLYNPNNVAFEASPITTLLELETGKDLAEMFGYNVEQTNKDSPLGWGHLTCGGTRNLKFYPLALRDALASGKLPRVSDTFKVTTCHGEEKLLKDLDVWELLNLKASTILDMPEQIQNYGFSSEYLDEVMQQFIIQTISKQPVEKRWEMERTPVYFVPSTKHYSWPKAAAITGIGSSNLINVQIDHEARLDTHALREALEECLASKKPVYAVVAVVGTTEEGAVDPLDEILKIREEFEKKGMTFLVHADAAWGGYFTSMIRLPPADGAPSKEQKSTDNIPHIALSERTANVLAHLQYADTITVDPHKAGYIPYAAGAHCYRDGRMRYMMTFNAPYLHQGDTDSIGSYGVEGSKAGAAAAAVWMNHSVIGLHQNGMGTLLGEAAFTGRRFASFWAAMSTDSSSFVIRPMNLLPSEKGPNPDPAKIEEERQYIRDHILGKDNADIAKDPEAMRILNGLGSDLNINAFACNFRYSDGRLNDDVEEANYLNRRLFERLSVTSVEEDPRDTPFYLTSTVFLEEEYGQCSQYFKGRLGLKGHQDLFVLRNVVMSPFSTSGNFVQKLMNIFKTVLEEEVENLRNRNEDLTDVQTFVLHGTKQLYIEYLPTFHKASGRYQVVTSASVPSEIVDKYLSAKRDRPQAQVLLRTCGEEAIRDMLNAKQFQACISFDDGNTFTSQGFKVDITDVALFRSIHNSVQLADYPDSFVPFYAYGIPGEYHITHTLLLDPNTQLSASNVELKVEPPIPDEKLKSGLFIFIDDIGEKCIQPIAPANKRNTNFFFKEGATFNVTVYDNVYAQDWQTTIDFTTIRGKDIAKGTMKLGPSIYIDNEKLNYENMTEPTPHRYAGHPMQVNTKQKWAKKLDSQLGTSRSKGLDVLNKELDQGKANKGLSLGMSGGIGGLKGGIQVGLGSRGASVAHKITW
ncbi:hypothetical protein PQX77_006814 [Marasmius sp. AFHP31]|nr:hypothetical protein PQX77_006814 [Marasmius sp. AFHP31]